MKYIIFLPISESIKLHNTRKKNLFPFDTSKRSKPRSLHVPTWAAELKLSLELGLALQCSKRVLFDDATRSAVYSSAVFQCQPLYRLLIVLECECCFFHFVDALLVEDDFYMCIYLHVLHGAIKGRESAQFSHLQLDDSCYAVR